MEYKDYGSIQSTDMRRTICVEASLKAAVLPSRSLPNCGLENLHDDVFDAILGMLLSDPTNDAIKNLSCLSRGLRNLHVIYIQNYWPPGWDDKFGIELPHLPNIHTVTFRKVDCGVPWSIIAACLEIPHIKSIHFQSNAMWTNSPPFPQAEVAQASNRLTTLSYTPYTWRESMSALEKSDLAVEYDLEAACLSGLLFGMTATAESLTLPFETAPLSRMSESLWPRLQSLSLYGRALEGAPAVTLSSLVHGMPSLRRLSVNVAALSSSSDQDERRSSSSTSTMLYLRSLTIAYPDPDDAIFSMVGATLRHLSLRDWPRYYYNLYCPGDAIWDALLLSSSSCLKILRRMNLTRLTDLELVYQADNAEEDLLRYLSSEIPYLAHLEIHRYRSDGDSCVPYGRIANILTGLRSLHTLHLNLNFDETCGIYCNKSHLRDHWRQELEAIGFEILHITQTGPELAFIALLHHRQVNSQWVEFYPSWHAKGLHADWDDAGLRGDSEPLPYVPFICR
ncbi:hypothetical protein TRAPUB_7151 [Trametes pubescens]|uniref:F-box domain-containing protein n=1 Tax=Trametes pubescens TaxID=154538 RepID=A0A1M2V3X9_TRAPU|nr:hypothetical protein TRAPUB_7151 [Trametes pubescens]